jgi:predicted nucleotidyltransferase
MSLQTIKHLNTSDEISLKDLISKVKTWYGFLLSKFWIILVCGLIGGLIGYAYAYNKKTSYSAVTTFVLEDGGSNASPLGNLGGLASMVGVDLGGGGGGIFQGDNILELYKSRTMIEKTLMSKVDSNGEKILLIDLYINLKGLRGKWKDDDKLKTIQFKNLIPGDRLRDSVLGVVVQDINDHFLNVAKLDKKLSIIRAEVKAPEEFFAKAFNDQIVKNVNDFYVQTKTQKSLQNVQILQHKADSVRSIMNGSINTAAAVLDATPNINPTRQAQRTAPSQRSQFSAETNKAVLGEMVKNLEISKMALLKETPLIQVIDKPIFPLAKERFGKVKGVVIGGFIAGLIAILFISFKLFFRKISYDN